MIRAFTGRAERTPIVVEKREAVSTATQDREILEALGLIEGGSSFNIGITERTALNITAVWSAVRYIADTIAMLPTYVQERVSDDEFKRIHDHPVAEFLRSPMPECPEYTTTQTLLASANLHGNGLALIEWSRGRDPIGLRIMDARSFNARYLDARELFPKAFVYEFPVLGASGYRFAPNDVLHIRTLCTISNAGNNVYKGLSPIKQAARTLAIATAGDNYSGHLYAGGAKPAGVVSLDGTMSDEAYKRFRESLNRIMSRIRSDPGAVDAGPLILEDGATFNPWGMTAEDVQLLMTRRFQVEEIARLYRVPPHKIGSLEKSSFNNIEQQNIDAVTDSLQPWVEQLEQEFSRKLIHPSERGRFRVRFDLNGVLRGDFKSRTEGYRNLAMIGSMSADEARVAEGMNKLPNGMGSRPRVAVNTMPAPTTEQADKHVEKIITEAKTPTETAPGTGDGGDGDK
jgi:HK97 family phage portal protein